MTIDEQVKAADAKIAELEAALRVAQEHRHAQPEPGCQHQWRHGGANKLQNQKQCIKCGRVELDANQK